MFERLGTLCVCLCLVCEKRFLALPYFQWPDGLTQVMRSRCYLFMKRKKKKKMKRKSTHKKHNQSTSIQCKLAKSLRYQKGATWSHQFVPTLT